MNLAEALRPSNNNFDLIRLAAAVAVIVGHSYVLLPTPGAEDAIGRLLKFDYSGSLSVKVFFFLSGILVTNSLLKNPNLKIFLLSRGLRIWPALFVVLITCALVIGPLLTNINIFDYLSDRAVLKYVGDSLLMNVKFELPGVFKANSLTAVNGSLWTIPYEVFAYIFLACCGALGVLRHKLAATLLCLIVIIDPMLDQQYLFTWLQNNSEIKFLAPCFAMGVLSALYQNKLIISSSPPLAFFTLTYLFSNSPFKQLLFYAAIFSLIIYIATRQPIIRFKPKSDISYSVYLWGFPTQQCLVTFFPMLGLAFHQIAAILISIILGWLSWHGVEKHAMTYAKHLRGKILVGKTSDDQVQLNPV